jgi:macrolide-specific efflux system membrane fusion protein
MQSITPFLITLVLTGPTSASRGAPNLVVEEPQVTAIREVHIPARQPGVLEEILVDEGVMVDDGQQLAQIDDQEAKLRLVAAQREAEAAAAQARENIDVQAALAAAEVAEAEVADSKYINSRQPGAVPHTELRRQELTAKRALLQTEVAEMEFEVATKTAAAKEAMTNITQYDITSRQILAPFAGLVVERLRQAGEWVQAGDPVLRLVQMDRLRVQGRVSSLDYAPHEIEGRPVTITVQAPGGRTFDLQGRVGFVSQVVELGDDYRVWAEVENEPAEVRDNRVFWKLRPGMTVLMVVHMTDNQ